MCDYEKMSRKELEEFADKMRVERNTLLLGRDVKDIVSLWVETQRGCMHKCKEKHFEFSDMMWELNEEINKEKTEQ